VAFQIKDFASIVASMINHARSATTKATDWQPGSVLRTVMEAPGVEIEELYHQFFLGLREAIPVATFLSFGFDKLPPAYAHGFVSVSTEVELDDPITIPIGTPFTTEDGRTYLSTVVVVWSDNAEPARIPVAAEAAGTAYNVAAGIINASPLFDDDFEISNSLIANGKDAETDSEREARFADFVAALSRGTVLACEYAAKSAVVLDEDGNIYEYVTRSGMVEIGGFVRQYLYSSRGIPSADLINVAQRTIDGYVDSSGNKIPGYRSAGVRHDIIAMTERLVPFTAAVDPLPGYTVSSDIVQSLLDAYTTALIESVPGSTLYMDTLINEYLLAVRGVRQVIPASNSNIICAANEVLKPGTFVITSLS
jgi:hypothetical protein